NARALLDRIVRDKLLTASGVYGFWPVASEGDDIALFAGKAKAEPFVRFNMLRQQEAMSDGKPNLSLADFVAPRSHHKADFIVAFAVTAGIGAGELAHRVEREDDDYNAMLVKGLADRPAAAFADW